MPKLSRKTFHAAYSVFLLSVFVVSFSFAQVVIKDTIDIGPKQTVHQQSVFSSPPGEVVFQIQWQQDANGIPTPVHLLVLDPLGNLSGFDPNSETSSGDYIESQQDSLTQLSIASPPSGQYWLYMMVDTSVNSFTDAFLHIKISVDGNSYGEPTYYDYGGFADLPGTPFRVGDASWDLFVQCVSNNLTLVVPQIGYVYQPSPYDEEVDLYIQDGCGNRQDPGIPYYIRAELLDGLQWGDLYDSHSGKFGTVLDSIPIMYGQGMFDYRPWGNVVLQPEQVDLKISSTFPGFAPVTQNFQVLPGSPPLEVLANRDTVSYGDTTAIKFIMQNSDGTPSTGQLISSRFTIVEGDSLAFLYSPDSSVVGTDIYGLDSVLLYVPPMANASDSASIKIVVSANEPCPECGASIAARNGTKTLQAEVKGKKSNTAGKAPLSLREVIYKKQMQVLLKRVASSSKMAVKSTKNAKVPINSVLIIGGSVLTHSGMGIITVTKRKSLKILNHQPWTIWPTLPKNTAKGVTGYNNKRDFSIQLLDGAGQPVPGEDVKIKTEFVPFSGGHNHNVPSLTPRQQGTFYGQGKNNNPLELTTDGTGVAKVDSFLTSEVSGNYVITAFWVTDTTIEDTVNLESKVPGLIAFSTSGNYQLTGKKDWHPNNHYFANQVAVDSLISAANSFAKAKWNTTGNMRLNDMSLVNGGVFDINQAWTNGSGHKLHRTGRSVDIENLDYVTIDTVSQKTGNDTTFRVPKVKWIQQFQDFMETSMKNWKFLDEGQDSLNVFKRTYKFAHFEWQGK